MTGKRILILGADGMVGRCLYSYLSKNIDLTVYGTTRKKNTKKTTFILRADHLLEDFSEIPKVDFIINCIGKLKGSNEEELKSINEEFPKNLVKILLDTQTVLIHISTDAVFDELSKIVTESSIPNPNELYGKSKLQGEIHFSPHITIRTSFLGIGEKGLLHWVQNNQDQNLAGFTNQLWSGCTTLQFAKLCEDLILDSNIKKNLKNTHMLHFAPIGPISKYEIIQNIVEVFGINKKVVPQKSNEITRILRSEILDLKGNLRYTDSIQNALTELKLFESHEEEKTSIHPRNKT